MFFIMFRLCGFVVYAINDNVIILCFDVFNYVTLFMFHYAAVDFFGHVDLLYATITEFCTPETCPIMSAGPKYVVSFLM